MMIQGVLYNLRGGFIQAKIIAAASTGPGMADGMVAKKSITFRPVILVLTEM